jgi:hypothetical protein
MDDKDEDDEDEEMDDESGEEVIVVPDPNTPSRRSLPSTIVVKRRHIERRPGKERDQNIWTLYYFDVVPLDET